MAINNNYSQHFKKKLVLLPVFQAFSMSSVGHTDPKKTGGYKHIFVIV